MSETNEALDERVDTYSIGLQAVGEMTETQPIYRIVIDVSYSNALGQFQSGYYIQFYSNIHFIAKKSIEVTTNSEAEKVFAFLQKTQAPFTIYIRRKQTLSAHQYIQAYDIENDAQLYELKEYSVIKGLWQTIEGVLYQNKWYTTLSKWIGDRLVWYANLQPVYPVKFKQVSTISVKFFDSQGHLEIFKIIANEPYAFPSYLYSERKKMTFFNHTVNGLQQVIPLGAERRILHVGEETTITSPDHLSITLPVGEYLLFHPRPREQVD
jgi:hypothetical protein